MAEININSKKLVRCLKKKLTRWKKKHSNLGGNKSRDEVPFIRVGEEDFFELICFRSLMHEFIESGVFTKDDFNKICREAGITTPISFKKIGLQSLSICTAQDPAISLP